MEKSSIKRKRKSSNEIENEIKLKKLKCDSKSKSPKKVIKKVYKSQDKKAKKIEIVNNKSEDNIDGNIESQKVHNEIKNDWVECDMLSYVEKIPKSLAENFVNLLNEGCTLPFIARYRKTMIDNLMPDRLQELYESYQSICLLKKKVKNVIETLKKSKKLTPEIEKSILNAKSSSEVEFIYAPLKSHAVTLADRARKLGLEQSAISALNGRYIDPSRLCNLDEEELSTVEKIDTHLTHIVADIIYKDPRVMEEIRKLKEQTRFLIQSSRSKSSKNVEGNAEKKKYESKSDPETYKIYFDWKCPCQFVKPHQTLAINRGEDEKILSIKVVVPDWFYNQLERFCLSIWKSSYWVKKGLSDAFNRLIKSWLSRQVRSDLTKVAEKEAVKTFTGNLEKYLLTEPIKNRRIVGIDPGFKAGCKIGIIDAEGNKLDVCTIYPNLKNHNKMDAAAKQLQSLMSKQNVELIGLGNGTACRETECWLKYHNISEHVPVVIVPEHGASVYSISKEAQKEHPDMDPNLISALSIARRVLDPLGELIKVDPKNLGVGMYQHDIPPKMLESALDCTVEKVVSLVGVDLNTASLALLRRISGLNESRAKNIISHRQHVGGFECREELLKVRGVGRASYQQCAGFVRVRGTEPLDFTAVHPESYNLARKFAKKLGLDTKNLLKPEFGEKAEMKLRCVDIGTVSKELDTDVCTLELIMNAFKQKPVEDNLVTFSKPVYSVTVQQMDQLQEGMSVTGVVRNVVPFGCFVDCGIRDNGLIHTSQFGANPTPKLGDRVAVTVIAMAKPGKISLRLDRILD